MSLAELLESATLYRNGYSEEIPEEIIHGKLKYKVQVNWLNGIGLAVLNAQEEGLLDDAIKQRYKDFVHYLTETDIWHRRSTLVDIQRGNELLDLIIAYCKAELGKQPKPSPGS